MLAILNGRWMHRSPFSTPSARRNMLGGGGGESLVDKGGIVILFICFSVGQTRWVRVILEFVILNFVMVLFELVGLCNMVLGKKPE